MKFIDIELEVGFTVYDILSNPKAYPGADKLLGCDDTPPGAEGYYVDLRKAKSDPKVREFLLPILRELSTDPSAWDKLDRPLAIQQVMDNLKEAVKFLEH